MTDLMNTTSTTTTDGPRDEHGEDSPDAGTGVQAQFRALREELAALRTELVRLDADLDESRRLNLRAAELLDIVYEELGAPRTARGNA